MATYIEKLQDSKFKDKTESLIGGHIMAVYRDAGLEPPVPFIGNNDQFTYVDQGKSNLFNNNYLI